MNEMIRKLEFASCGPYPAKDREALLRHAAALRALWHDLTEAKNIAAFEAGMKQVAGLYARAKNDFKDITGQDILPKKHASQM